MSPLNCFQAFIKQIKLLTVEPYGFLVLLGYTLRIAPFQNLLMDRSCRIILNYPEDTCNNLDDHEEEQTLSIEYGNNLYTGVMLMSSLPTIVVALFLGPWSDKYTRKYPMIIAVSGMFFESLSSTIFAAIPTISPYWYVITSIFSGITGGYIISSSSAFSYMSDITDEKSRPTRFAILEFFNIAAIVVGTQLSGHVFNAFGYVTVLAIAPCCFAAALVYTILLVPEVKQPIPRGRRWAVFKDLFRIDNIKMSYATCARKRPGNMRLQIWLLVWIALSQKFIDMGTIAIAFPYVKKVFRWTVVEFSNAVTIYYVVNAAVTIGLVPCLSSKFRLHEAALGVVGILSLTAKMINFSVAINAALFYYAWLSGSLSNSSTIAVRSRLSKLVSKEELGRVFSLLGTCESFTPLLGSLTFLQLYNASVRFFPGMPFAVGGLLLLPCAFIFLWMMRMPTVSLAEYARKEDEAMKTKNLTPINSISQVADNVTIDCS